MAALRVKRGLEAGFLARRVAAGRAPLSASSLQSTASAASRTFLDQHRKHLSGTATTTFEYKPLFQYDATPRDDPTKVCVRACWRVIGRVHAAWLWRFLVATFGSWRSLRLLRLSKSTHNSSLLTAHVELPWYHTVRDVCILRCGGSSSSFATLVCKAMASSEP